MPFLPLVVLLFGVGTAAAWVDRRLQARKRAREANGSEAEPSEEADGVAMKRGVKGWYDRIVHRTPADLPQRFRAWAVSAAADDTAVKNWLKALSDDEGLPAFTKHLAVFCSDMGFELMWLVEQTHDKNPEWVHAAERTVLHYCRACQQATTAQEDFEAHKRILEFEQNPSSKKNEAFGKNLFAKVIEAKLATGSISEYLMQPPVEQRRRVREAIREAVEKDSVAFDRVVKEVVRGNEPGSEAASTSATSAGPESTASESAATPA